MCAGATDPDEAPIAKLVQPMQGSLCGGAVVQNYFRSIINDPGLVNNFPLPVEPLLYILIKLSYIRS